MLWIFKFGSWNRHHLFKSPWLGHLKFTFTLRKSYHRFLFSIYHIYSLGLKGENEQIWLQILTGYSLTLLILYILKSPCQFKRLLIITRIPLFFCLPKPTETTLGCDQTLGAVVFWEQSSGSVDSLLGISNSLYFTVTFPVIHQQFIFGCWTYTLPLKTNYS